MHNQYTSNPPIIGMTIHQPSRPTATIDTLTAREFIEIAGLLERRAVTAARSRSRRAR